MNRLMAMVVAGAFVLAVGCGTQSYEKRLEKTIENMNYQKRLNASLTDAPAKGKLEELQIYVRPPKNMTGPAQAFQLAVVEPGRFDLESSFVEPEKQSLHLLARVERPKTPTKKAPTPAETAPRGDFNTDVVDLLKSVYGVELKDPADQLKLQLLNVGQFKEDKRRENTFGATTIDLNEKTIQVYLYGGKNSPHKVALIFEYPKTERNAVEPKIALCLESFAVGERARRAFGGGDVEEEGGEAPTEEASSTGVF